MATTHRLTEWVPVREDQNPTVGDTIRKVPELAVDHGDGSGHAERLDELGECQGTIRQVGAHWSEAGASGWWVLVEYTLEALASTLTAPILTTRIPEGRTVPLLEYGAHYSHASGAWEGYHVRPAGSVLPFGIARMTPASDELPESNAAIVGEIGTELRRFARWCEHYGYDPESPKAARDYEEARENLAALETALASGAAPPSQAGDTGDNGDSPELQGENLVTNPSGGAGDGGDTLQEGDKLTVTMSGPNGEYLAGEHEVPPGSLIGDEALRAAHEEVLEAHEQLDQDTQAEGPEHWAGWTVEVHQGEQLLYEERMDQLLGELLPIVHRALEGQEVSEEDYREHLERKYLTGRYTVAALVVGMQHPQQVQEADGWDDAVETARRMAERIAPWEGDPVWCDGPAWLDHPDVPGQPAGGFEVGQEGNGNAAVIFAPHGYELPGEANTATPEPYRFDPNSGSLYRYTGDGYIHCYRSATARTLKEAVTEYERDMEAW